MSKLHELVPGEYVRPVRAIDQLWQSEFWIDSTGFRRRIEDLTDQHLLNIVRALVRAEDVMREEVWVDMLTCEPPRGEMAADIFWSEMDRLEEQGGPDSDFLADTDLFIRLLKELDDRKLRRPW